VERAPDITICIASFRRPRGLVRLLESLSRQKLPEGVDVEIVVVDNDSAGEARSSAVAACDLARSVRWFVEPRQNLAIARNRGVSEARGRWIAFIDDDEVADESWLAAYWRLVENDAGDGFFGPVLPRLDEVVTPWLDAETFYSRLRHPSGTPLAWSEVSTSNAFVRRSLFSEHRFDPSWGLSGGEDSEVFGRMLDAGARFVACDEALVYETIPPRRHRLGWLSQRAFRGGVSFTRLQRQRRLGGAVSRGLPRALLALAILTPALPLSLFGGRAAASRVWLRICTQIGHLWAFAGLRYEEYRCSGERAPLD